MTMTWRTLDQATQIDGANNCVRRQGVFPGPRDPLMVKLSAAPVRPNHHHVKAGHKPMSNSETLVSLIVGVCQQDPERWRQFDGIYRPMLRAYLRKQGLKECDASDVVQDIFVRLLGKIQTYKREKCRFRSWLFSVAHNALIDAARRRASRKKALEGWVLNVLRATPSDSVRMEEEWTAMHRERILKHALKVVRARVSSRVWACFVQRVFHDHPAAQIARDLNLEPNAVYVNACRVMKQVRTVCEEFEEDMSHAFESDLS
jgi:RNA polymerase sigma factor (sigma-70 family)